MRQRKEDIPALTEHFMRTFMPGFTIVDENDVYKYLANEALSGNVRTLSKAFNLIAINNQSSHAIKTVTIEDIQSAIKAVDPNRSQRFTGQTTGQNTAAHSSLPNALRQGDNTVPVSVSSADGEADISGSTKLAQLLKAMKEFKLESLMGQNFKEAVTIQAVCIDLVLRCLSESVRRAIEKNNDINYTTPVGWLIGRTVTSAKAKQMIKKLHDMRDDVPSIGESWDSLPWLAKLYERISKKKTQK